MKKRVVSGVVLLALICSVVLFTSCESPIEAKALVVKNTGEHAINYVEIMQYVSGSKISVSSDNALDVDETITPGESKTFYLAPYGKNAVYLNIQDSNDAEKWEMFTYDYLVEGKNETITATFDGIEIKLQGSKVTEILIM